VRLVLDNSGSTTNAVTYDAFGNVASGGLSDRYGFTAAWWDGTTTLYSLGNGIREYNLKTGQFAQVDPLGFDAGDTNPRRYVGNSPTNATDPSGKTLFVPASDVEWWRAVGEGNIGFLPVAGGNYQIALGPGGRNGPLHERIKAALAARGMSESDIAATLNAL